MIPAIAQSCDVYCYDLALTIGVDRPVIEAKEIGLSPETLAIVRRGMGQVVNHVKGTAYSARIEETRFAMGGKTGTSQVRGITDSERKSGIIKNEDRPWDQRDHALFVGYAPVSAPRYSVAVIVEHGGSGSRSAAPMAHDILLETQRLDPLSTLSSPINMPPGETRKV
jgi:penicillin-binding protein 2